LALHMTLLAIAALDYRFLNKDFSKFEKLISFH